jgi:hypothetical protein
MSDVYFVSTTCCTILQSRPWWHGQRSHGLMSDVYFVSATCCTIQNLVL